MKLLGSISTLLLAGVAAGATQNAADVYILDSHRSSSSSSSPPAVPRQIARQILLQRLGADRDALLDDLPKGVDEDQAVSYITEYGKALPSLFGDSTAQTHAQAVVFLEGVTDKDAATIKSALAKSQISPSFTVADPPRSKAVQSLLDVDLPRHGVTPSSCGVGAASNPYDPGCWSNDETFVSSYDMKKGTETANEFINILPKILALVENAELEVMLLLMPEASRTSSIAHWTTKEQSHLRPRALSESETVMSEEQHKDTKDTVPETHKAAAGSSPNTFALEKKKKITTIHCFGSFDECMEQTGNCTGGHGKCVDKFLVGGKQRRADEEEKHCFKCHCQPTVIGQGKDGQYERTEHWGGAMCQKKDISVPFWLITGFTVTIIGAISFSIGLLFQVGEQKLPGVIGAGVSRSK